MHNTNDHDLDGITVEQILGDYYKDGPVWLDEDARVDQAAKTERVLTGEDATEGDETVPPDWRKAPGGLPGKLLACAKSVILFGGLNCLIFYWAKAGLMDSSVAVPSMCVCAALAGWGVGKNAPR